MDQCEVVALLVVISQNLVDFNRRKIDNDNIRKHDVPDAFFLVRKIWASPLLCVVEEKTQLDPGSEKILVSFQLVTCNLQTLKQVHVKKSYLVMTQCF